MKENTMNIKDNNSIIQSNTHIKKKVNMYAKSGNDNGNSEHDIIIEGELITQPNVYAKIDELPLLDEINIEKTVENLEDRLIVTINSPSVKAGTYYIGNYALHSGKRLENMEVGVDNDKANSDVVIINTLGHIAGYSVKKLYETDKKLESDIEIIMDMVTALPVKQYSKATAKILQERFLGKKHSVTVHVGLLRVDVDIYFDYVKVLPESVPIVFLLQNIDSKNHPVFYKYKDEENNKKINIKENIKNELLGEFEKEYEITTSNEYFKNKKILHIAPGEGTTEFPITRDIEFDPEFINGTDNGIGHAIEEALPAFKKAVGLRTFTRQSFSEILKNEEHKYYKRAMYHITDPLIAECKDIVSTAKHEIEKANNDVDIIFAHGGGSISMKDKLYKDVVSLGKKADIKVLYAPKKYAVILEVLGMYEFVNGEIFNMLKERYINNQNKA